MSPVATEAGTDRLIGVVKDPDGYRMEFNGRVLDTPMSKMDALTTARNFLAAQEDHLVSLRAAVENQGKLIERVREDVARIEEALK